MLALALLALAARRAGWLETARAAAWLEGYRRHHDAWATAGVYLLGWGLLASAGFPAIPLVLAGGALFGTLRGTLLALAGTALGALGGYLLARGVAPPFAQRWITRRLGAAGLADRSTFWALVRIRVMPVVPFGVVNFGAGMARVPLRPYLASTLVGQLPSTALYAHLADRVLAAVARGRGALREVVLVSVLLAVVSLAGWGWNARGARQARRGAGAELPEGAGQPRG